MNALASQPKVKDWIESRLIDATASANNWICKHVVSKGERIAWQDQLRWWIEGKLDAVFAWAYDGSEAEIISRGEIPPMHMSERQRAVLDQYDPAIDAHCCDCRWTGSLAETLEDTCPACREAVWIDGFEDGGDR